MARVHLRFSLPSDPAGFDLIEVHRSAEGEAGPFEELTHSRALGARLPPQVLEEMPASPETGPLVLAVGKTLVFLVGGQERTVTLTGVDPLTLSQVASQVSAAHPSLLRSFVLDGRLVVETVAVGGLQSLELVSGSAAGVVGLVEPGPGYGKDARLLIVPGQQRYALDDNFGDLSFHYKVRLRNSVLGLTSPFGPVFGPDTGLPDLETVVGYLTLVDSAGRPVPNREVLAWPRADGTLRAGAAVVARPTSRLTDAQGYVEFSFVRGVTVSIGVSDTNLVRDITAPTDSSIERFNLLDPSFGSDDNWQVQVPQIPWATRRSL